MEESDASNEESSSSSSEDEEITVHVLDGHSLTSSDETPNLETRLTCILSKFENMEEKVIEAKANWTSFLPFGDVIIEYKNRFQESFNKPRRISQEEKLRMAENHWFLDFNLLHRWMSNVQVQEDIIQIINQVEGAAVLNQNDDLTRKLENNGQYGVLVLFVPSPDGWCNKIMNTMGSCKDPFIEMDDSSDDNWYNPSPWHEDQSNRKLVVDKLHELAEHVKENVDQVKFYIKLTDNNEDFICHYSIYNAAAGELVSELDQLPVPPTNLTISSALVNGKIEVKWECEDVDYPSKFLIQYRHLLKENWTGKKTSYSVAYFCPGPAREFRVATDTCVGRSKFSSVVIVPELRKQADPVVQLIAHNTADLEWPPQPNGSEHIALSYQIRYKKSNIAAPFRKIDAGFHTRWRLEKLQPETTYSVNVAAVFAGKEEIRCAPSELIQFTTLKKRFAYKMVERWQKMGSRNDLDLYTIPLKKLAGSATSNAIERYVFSEIKEECNTSSEPNELHKTIMLLGPADKSKITLINAMINYIFDVNWEDKFRFQLIEDKMDIQHQTSSVKVYTIRHAVGFRIPYSLTIVDVVQDAKFLEEYDMRGPEMIRNFLESENQQVDFVSLVFQPSEYNSVLSFFGKDLKGNSNFILTTDKQMSESLSMPSQFEDFHRHNIKSEDFFQSNRLTDSSSWGKVQKNFDVFFNQLSTMKTKSLLQTKCVLEERRRFETALDELQSQIMNGLVEKEEMWDAKQSVIASEKKIHALSKKIDKKKEDSRKVELPAGQYVSNCSECRVTCHHSRFYASWGCTPSCRVCPGKCDSTTHSAENYKWERILLPIDNFHEINEKLKTERNLLQVLHDRVGKLEKDVCDIVKGVDKQIEVLWKYLQNLDKIALCNVYYILPNSIDEKIKAEIEKKQPGSAERIEILRKSCLRSEIIGKINSKRSLLALMDSRSNSVF